jgi:hypothetical protein
VVTSKPSASQIDPRQRVRVSIRVDSDPKLQENGPIHGKFAKSIAGIRGVLPGQSTNSGFFTEDVTAPQRSSRRPLCGANRGNLLLFTSTTKDTDPPRRMLPPSSLIWKELPNFPTLRTECKFSTAVAGPARTQGRVFSPRAQIRPKAHEHALPTSLNRSLGHCTISLPASEH